MRHSIPHLCGSIASIPSDLGVRIHNAAYRAVDIPYTYVAFGTDSAEDALTYMRKVGMRGLSIGVPHKQAVIPFLDEVDDVARTIGAVNAVVNIDGRLIGYNVDWIGAERALLESVKLSGKRVAILGAGGAARAIAYAVRRNGGQIDIFNRTVKKAEQLVREFELENFRTFSELDSLQNYDLIINATSVGFFDEESLIVPLNFVPRHKAVFEAVFYPVKTALYRAAEQNQNQMIQGYRMLLHLAGHQFELYTKMPAPLKEMEVALLTGLKEKELKRDQCYLGAV